MQSSAWIALLRLIPPEQHDNLVLTPVNGLEINIQAILRTEEAYLVMRGRLSGSTDTGRIFFVPYDQIAYLNFHRLVKETEVHAFYGDAPVSAAPTAPPSAAAESAADSLPETAEPPPAPEAAPPVGAEAPLMTRMHLPAKSAILDRLRARVAPNPPKPPDK